MTNVDFFRAFCKDTTTVADKPTEYYFDHGREELDFGNLYDGEDENDVQIKIFHYTTNIKPEINENGSVEGVNYDGEFYVAIKSDIDEVIDAQKGVPYAEGKYELRVKNLIEDGGILAIINSYNNCQSIRHELDFTSMKEVYNFEMDFNTDGVFVTYTMYIET